VWCGRARSRAPADLGYTHSAVSQQVAALETEVGQRLVERRPVRPTAAGERLAEHATRILLRVDAAKTELARLREEPAPLVVGVCPLAAPDLLAAALRELRAQRPSARVVVRSSDVSSAVGGVASGELDVALVDGITAPDSPLALADAGVLASTALVETSLVVALPADHPLARRSTIDLDVLADAPWVLAPGNGLGGASHVTYAGADLATMLALVAGGHGSALLPSSACHGVTGVVGVALRHPVLVHRTEALTLRTPSGMARELIDALRSRALIS